MKTKQKLATMEEVRAAATRIFGMSPDSDDPLCFTDRESAGDDDPPAHLVRSMREKAQRLRDMFPHVVTSGESIDEWYSITVRLLDKPRIDRPEWKHEKLLAFFELTIKPELAPHHHKVMVETKPVINGYPRVLAFYGQKWNEFSELSFFLRGDSENGWEVDARFGCAATTHKVTTSRGLLQTVWKKLKAEIGDLSVMDNIHKKGQW